jgi:predicted RNase H-like HicB family nuclease/predicted transcriptional regulator
MALHYYRALLVQDADDGPDAGYGVVFPDFPGATSVGVTPLDAAQQAAEALSGHVALMLEDGQALPDPSEIGAALPDWLEGDGRVVGEVLVPVDLPGRTVRANITVDEALLRKIDQTAQASGTTRSGLLAEAARGWLRANRREWADKRARDLQRQLDLLRSGKMTTGETRATGDVDTTAASIAQIEGWLAELPAILKAGE